MRSQHRNDIIYALSDDDDLFTMTTDDQAITSIILKKTPLHHRKAVSVDILDLGPPLFNIRLVVNIVT